MKPDELYELYNENLISVLNKDMMASLSDKTSNIEGLNFINRLLVYIQNKYATSLKSEYGWEVVGRVVNNKSTPIWIIDDISKTYYSDTETGKTIDIKDLSSAELSKAVELGVLTKRKDVTGLKCLAIYNIKDTKVSDSMLYKEYAKSLERKIKFSTLLNVLNKSYGINPIKGDTKSRFELDTMSLYVGSDSITDRLDIIGEILVRFTSIEVELFNCIDNDIIDETKAQIIAKLALTFIQESIKSFILTDYYVDPNKYKDIKNLNFSESNIENDSSILDIFLNVMDMAYEIIEKFISDIRPPMNIISDDKLRKMAELLAIMEANNAIVSIKDGVI